MRRKLFFVVFGSILFFSCSENKEQTNKGDNIGGNSQTNENKISAGQTVLDPAEYIEWMRNEDNGFRKEKTVDDLTFTVQYKTQEYIACIEQRGDPLPDSILKRKSKELEGMEYYDFKISMNDGAGELLKYKLETNQQYNDRVNYFAFGMQKDIVLMDGKDSIPCGLYHFERAYDVSPTAVVLLGFPASKKNNSDKTLIVYDRTFNKGTLKFMFKANELNNKPKLQTL